MDFDTILLLVFNITLVGGIITKIICKCISKYRKENKEENLRLKAEYQRIAKIIRKEEKEMQLSDDYKPTSYKEKTKMRKRRIKELLNDKNAGINDDFIEIKQRKEQEDKIFDLLKQEAQKNKQEKIEIQVNN
ncbi:hypothetical protein BCR36DRAFT_351358 [Piromyces finnis]|uniref:Uncharacterized protein n=1 Tax=Piromyces finnis TaxID=1754191 RepID=A0A1Y1VC67_9FUNG|nr:hypothetical protein BCR36DRAFT_351358 [Piromyces finnis]|eukprot:ORX51500.1 hypothetical protein BCR36DRAFT_351358 [Piromyces finnis]